MPKTNLLASSKLQLQSYKLLMRSWTSYFYSSEEKVYYLEAPDQQTMMYWLQQLQKKRRAYSRKKTTLSTEKAQLKTVHVSFSIRVHRSLLDMHWTFGSFNISFLEQARI